MKTVHISREKHLKMNIILLILALRNLIWMQLK